MTKLLALAAVAEFLTGVVLLVHPSIVVWALFGAEIAGPGAVMSRLAGISLIGLGLACWPDRARPWGLYGLFAYSTLAMLYLAAVGIGHESSGVLLWPMVAIHAGLSALVGAAAWRGTFRAQ